MKEQTIVVNEKIFKIRELKYTEGIEISDLPKKEQARKMIQLSCGLSDEEVDKLSFKEGIELQKAINNVNDFNNFQNPAEGTKLDQS